MTKKAIIIGSGFSGLVSAGVLADGGFDVTVFEKNDFLGGRASSMNIDGFHFDKGPSWYWMPDVYEHTFQRLGADRSELYDLIRLDPAYRVYFGKEDYVDIPDDYDELLALFDKLEPGSSEKLIKFMDEAEEKYRLGMNGMARLPSVSVIEYFSWSMLQSATKMNLFSSVSQQVRSSFKNEYIRKIMEFPVLFLGASASSIPALYTMMNYAGLKMGTFYPVGGYAKVVDSLVNVVKEKGVNIEMNAAVTGLKVSNNKAKEVVIHGNRLVTADVIVGSGDYAHIEGLLEPSYRNYSEQYWKKRVFAPSALLFFVGLNRKLNNIQHHNLFFHTRFDDHIKAIYNNPKWPDSPLFYVCCPSRTDDSVAPNGHENLFFLMPIATGLDDGPETRAHYFDLLISEFEKTTGEKIKENIVVSENYGLSNFKEEYNAYGGNAYGLANTLRQTGILKPSIRNKKISNLFYTGQLTVPGPGVPPALMSGEIVADYIIKNQDVFKTRI